MRGAESVSYLTKRALMIASQVVERDLATRDLVRRNWICPAGAGPVGVNVRTDALHHRHRSDQSGGQGRPIAQRHRHH